jgi:hypothetical protein
MNDAAFMRMGQGVGDLRPVADNALRREAVGGDEGTEGLPLDIGHRNEALTFVLTDFLDRADVRVVQRRRGAGFLRCPIDVDAVVCLGTVWR